MRFDKKFIIEAVPQVTFLYDTFPAQMRFSVDTRVLAAGDVFVALKGAVRNGHDFITQALAQKAAGIICQAEGKAIIDAYEDKQRLAEIFVAIVPNTFDALIDMARLWRSQFTFPVIAVTGSVGKTSTKELIAHTLTCHGTFYLATRGNQNTLLGIALNMLRLTSDCAGAIFEIGIDRRGQMQQKVQLVKPTISVITGVGHCHLEGLGSIADVATEKRDVFSSFRDDNIGIINGDHALLANVGYRHPMIRFGLKTRNQVQARKIVMGERTISFILKLYKQKFVVTLPTNHPGFIYNALAAVAVCYILGVPIATILRAIETQPSVAQRFEIRVLKDNKGKVIDDCYNANPESMKAALIAFHHIKTTGKKIAVLGDMLELGIDSAFWHRQLGRFLRKVPSLDALILVGNQVQWVKETAPQGLRIEHVFHWSEAVAQVHAMLSDPESVVLVKGSHGMQLEHLVAEIGTLR